MLKDGQVGSALDEAHRLEKNYDWLSAAEFYKKALDSAFEMDSLEMGQIYERTGYAHYRASMQAEDESTFGSRMRRAMANYEKAKESYEKMNEPGRTSRVLRCDAAIAYMGYWLVSEAPEKKKLLDECWRLVKESLKAFKETGDELEYGKTYNQLSSSIVLDFCLEWDFQAREKMIREAVESGEQAIKFLSSLEDPPELARAYARTAFYLGVFDYFFLDMDDREKDCQKVHDYWQKAKELSEDEALFEFLPPIFGAQLLLWGDGTEEALANLKKALEYGWKTRDKFIIGCALDWLVYHTYWQPSHFRARPTEDREYRSARFETMLQYADDARRQYFPLSFISPRGDVAWIETLHADHFLALSWYETDLRKKRVLLERARQAYPDALRLANVSGYPSATIHANHMFAAILLRLAEIETRSGEKKRLLQKALEHRHEAVQITKKLEPTLRWSCGVMQSGLARVKYELADLTKNSETRKSMLQEAILDMEGSLKLRIEWVRVFERQMPAAHAAIGFGQYQIGVWLNGFYELTRNTEELRKAAKAFAEAAESYQKVDAKSRVAECHWKASQIYDALGEHLKAAESFSKASNDYTSSSQKIPQLKGFYQDHALYMQAWSEIEKARHHHKRQEYGAAKECFEKAADLHKALKQWSYFIPDYVAWAKVEQAEDLSRKEQSESAARAFAQAIRLFYKTKKSLHTQLDKSEDLDEKQMATAMADATDRMREYCMGRIALEEARILDKKGDHYTSSRMYGSGAEIFEEIANRSDPKQSPEEFKLIITLSRAWQKMMLAEARALPQQYLEASQLFKQASEYSSSEKTSFLALGHSRFCKALEAGTAFEDTRDTALHMVATQHLESAATYYAKAGFQTTAEYAVATQHLFDGYIYMDIANVETDQEKKAKYFTIAEKVLKTSAESYMKAKHPEKAKQVRKLLAKVTERREMATSLSEVLRAPAIALSTANFATPIPTHEKAVGVEQFEHANIQGHLTVPEEVAVGEDLQIQLDLVNVAKNYGLLVRVDSIVPKGFIVTGVPCGHVVENGSIDFGGKRFEPLKVESIKILARADDFGIFKVKPQVIYVDETGQFRTCKPKAIHVKVLAPTRKVAEEKAQKKYKIVFRDLLKEFPRPARNECRVAIAQIGASKEDDVLSELYEQSAPGLFGLRQDKVETVRANVRKMIELAYAKKVNILLFPELTVDLNYSQLLKDVTTLAKAYEMYIIPGSYHNQKTRQNVSMVAGPDGILWQQVKHIPAIMHHQGKRFEEGIDVGAATRETIVCNTEFGRIAILICRDFLDMDLRVELKNFEPAVDLVFNPAFTPVTADFRAAHFDARRSIYAYCFFANVAEFGDSFIYTPEKERVERTIAPKEEGIIYKDVDIFGLRSERKKWEKEKRQFIQSTR